MILLNIIFNLSFYKKKQTIFKVIEVSFDLESIGNRII